MVHLPRCSCFRGRFVDERYGTLVPETCATTSPTELPGQGFIFAACRSPVRVCTIRPASHLQWYDARSALSPPQTRCLCAPNLRSESVQVLRNRCSSPSEDWCSSAPESVFKSVRIRRSRGAGIRSREAPSRTKNAYRTAVLSRFRSDVGNCARVRLCYPLNRSRLRSLPSSRAIPM